MMAIEYTGIRAPTASTTMMTPTIIIRNLFNSLSDAWKQYCKWDSYHNSVVECQTTNLGLELPQDRSYAWEAMKIRCQGYIRVPVHAPECRRGAAYSAPRVLHPSRLCG